MKDESNIEPEKPFNFSLDIKELKPIPISTVPIPAVKTITEE